MIVNCPECKREISDKANTCPHCGFQLRQPPQPPKPSQGCFMQTLNLGCLIFVVFIGLLLFGAAVNAFFMMKNDKPKQELNKKKSDGHKITTI